MQSSGMARFYSQKMAGSQTSFQGDDLLLEVCDLSCRDNKLELQVTNFVGILIELWIFKKMLEKAKKSCLQKSNTIWRQTH
jgi:hypothetical protein